MAIPTILLALAIAYLATGVLIMSTAVARLRASVAALSNVSASAITLLAGLAQAVRDNAEDPAALNALADEIDNDTAGLAESITLNTPVATAPGVQPDPLNPPSQPVPAADQAEGAGDDTAEGAEGSDTIEGTGAG